MKRKLEQVAFGRAHLEGNNDARSPFLGEGLLADGCAGDSESENRQGEKQCSHLAPPGMRLRMLSRAPEAVYHRPGRWTFKRSRRLSKSQPRGWA